MLERLIIDILKWIVIILIFFIAFACSLYLIFANFSASSEFKTILNGVSTPTNDIPKDNIMYNENLTTISRRCPPIFYNFSSRAEDYSNYYTQSRHQINNFCEKNDDTCLKIQRIGPSPAIHYFGKSVGATIATTFFTLFGVIADDDIPVNEKKRKNNFLYYFFFLGSWL